MLTEWNMYVKENYHRVSHLPNKERLKALSDMRENTNCGATLKAKQPAKKKTRGASAVGETKTASANLRAPKAKAKVSGGILDDSDLDNIIEQVFDKFDNDFGGFADEEVYQEIRESLETCVLMKYGRGQIRSNIKSLLNRLMPGNAFNPVRAESIANEFFRLIEMKGYNPHRPS
jgi:hypothetical protein